MDDLTQHPSVLMIGRLADYLLPLLAIEAHDIDDVMTSMASYLEEARRSGIEDCIEAIKEITPPGHDAFGALAACRDLLRASKASSQRGGRA
ncbi:hypothetical protein [Mesorhizobium sp. M4B.F.Ca.ET.143.01.1.1]|uniref:hypothetical protein n=1 Tax=Mesorhizobium sp. M4B.F.Ca.ET.143.01.1.1 TaxID=2563947 RepID=UPI0010940B30|nr:hypothetical protein [Mesorhizobium sp. M4B.F.Ca.ET.143.01.1.1]TGV26315.1 hypothetical protein EN786_12380 [Mesorhizobium sp. M4B.F.Ca.ET.143.01.1.1]